MIATYTSKRGPVEGCPQPETPIRERAWTDGQIERAAEAIWNSRSHKMLEHAGLPCDWANISRLTKMDCRKEARNALNAAIGAKP